MIPFDVAWGFYGEGGGRISLLPTSKYSSNDPKTVWGNDKRPGKCYKGPRNVFGYNFLFKGSCWVDLGRISGPVMAGLI